MDGLALGTVFLRPPPTPGRPVCQGQCLLSAPIPGPWPHLANESWQSLGGVLLRCVLQTARAGLVQALASIGTETRGCYGGSGEGETTQEKGGLFPLAPCSPPDLGPPVGSFSDPACLPRQIIRCLLVGAPTSQG